MAQIRSMLNEYGLRAQYKGKAGGPGALQDILENLEDSVSNISGNYGNSSHMDRDQLSAFIKKQKSETKSLQ